MVAKLSSISTMSAASRATSVPVRPIPPDPRRLPPRQEAVQLAILQGVESGAGHPLRSLLGDPGLPRHDQRGVAVIPRAHDHTDTGAVAARGGRRDLGA